MEDNESNISHSLTVLRLIEDLSSLRASEAAIAEDLARAESVVADLDVQRNRMQDRLRASEEALASSGDLPDGPFPEEHAIQGIDRQIRVAKSRVQIVSEKLAAIRVDSIGRIRKDLRAAFILFASGQVEEVRGRYRETALRLRDLYLEQITWLYFAKEAGMEIKSGPGTAIVADPVTGGALLDSRTIATDWERLGRPLRTQLKALQAEVTEAMGKTKARAEVSAEISKAAPAEHWQAGPGGAPDLAEYGTGADNAQGVGAWAGVRE